MWYNSGYDVSLSFHQQKEEGKGVLLRDRYFKTREGGRDKACILGKRMLPSPDALVQRNTKGKTEKIASIKTLNVMTESWSTRLLFDFFLNAPPHRKAGTHRESESNWLSTINMLSWGLEHHTGPPKRTSESAKSWQRGFKGGTFHGTSTASVHLDANTLQDQ